MALTQAELLLTLLGTATLYVSAFSVAMFDSTGAVYRASLANLLAGIGASLIIAAVVLY